MVSVVVDCTGIPPIADRLRDADPVLLRQPVVEHPAEPALAGYLDHDLDAVAVLARIGGLGDRSYQLDDATRIGTREHHPVRHAAMVSGRCAYGYRAVDTRFGSGAARPGRSAVDPARP